MKLIKTEIEASYASSETVSEVFDLRSTEGIQVGLDDYVIYGGGRSLDAVTAYFSADKDFVFIIEQVEGLNSAFVAKTNSTNLLGRYGISIFAANSLTSDVHLIVSGTIDFNDKYYVEETIEAL